MFTQSAFSVKGTGTPFSCRATRATAASSTPAAAMVHRGSSSSGHASLQVSWDHKVQEYMETALGIEQFSAMQAALTVPPLHTCVRVNTLRTTPQEVARQLHELLVANPVTADTAAPGGNPATPPAAASTANSNAHSNGCQRSGSSAGSRYGISCHPQVPAVVLEGSGPHAVDLSTVSKQALISRKAGEAVLRGAHVFVPGVLGCSAGVCAGDTVAVMVDMGGQGSTATRGMTLPALNQADNSDNSTIQQQQHQWLCAGIGKARVGRVEMFRLQHGVAVELTQRLYDVPSLNGQLQGLVMLQNLPSIVAAQVLNPPPGSRVLDMCASPGGKTTMLAQIMGCVGQVYALDRSHAKVDDIRSLAQELGCSSCITAIKMDATKAVAADGVGGLPSDEQQHSSAAAAGDGTVHVEQDQQQQQQQDAQQVEPLHELPQQQQLWPQQQQQQLQQLQQQGQQQQAVRAAPANMSAKSQQRLARRLAAMAARGHKPGAGEFRKCGSAPAVPKFPGFAPESFSHVLLDAPCTALGLRPKLQQPLTLREVLEAAAYQRQLLAAAVRLVQPGGYLVYSTCSVSPAENEINVRHALDTYPCLKLVPAEPRVGGPGLTGPADGARFAAVLAEAAASCADKPIPSVTVAAKEAAAAVAAAASWPLAAVAAASGQEGAAFWLTDEQASMVQRFYPGGQHDTIGFFAAKFQKVCCFE